MTLDDTTNYDVVYSDVDESSLGEQTIYDPDTDSRVRGIFLVASGTLGSDGELQVTDGTDTSVITDGFPLNVTATLPMSSADSLQVEITSTDTGSTTAVVFVEEK